MKKMTQPQQLSLLFDAPLAQQNVTRLESTSASACTINPLSFSDTAPSPAVVYDFQSAAVKREEASQAVLYRQILNSVRHIG